MEDSSDIWCIVRIPGSRYKKTAEALEMNYTIRKRLFSCDRLGYIFLKAEPNITLRNDLLENYPGSFFLWDHATKAPAVLKEEEVLIFTRILEETGLNIIFLNKDLSYYAEGRVELVCLDDPLKGMHGYIVRRKRNRNFVFKLPGGITASATNAHQLRLMTIEDYKTAKSEGLI